jgi:predicted 3-demethylubiquinone-9 3-methyltransferase (glyoxalase superfamily)
MKGNSSEAAHFYCAAFSDSSIIAQNPFVTTFKLAGQPFMALNGALPKRDIFT